MFRRFAKYNYTNMYRIFITNMRDGSVEEFVYKKKRQALNRFIGICKELGYEYTQIKTFNVFIAGGIGYRFRVELVEQK